MQATSGIQPLQGSHIQIDSYPLFPLESPPMSQDVLPLAIDPFRYTSHDRMLQGVVPLNRLARLLPDLLSDQGDVAVELVFGRDAAAGIPWLRGKLRATLKLQCQRCLEPFDYEIISGFLLGIVKSPEEAEHLPAGYDPLVAEGGEIVVQDMIEDELIVSMPVAARHTPDRCRAMIALAESAAASQPQKNPFEAMGVLKALQGQKKTREDE